VGVEDGAAGGVPPLAGQQLAELVLFGGGGAVVEELGEGAPAGPSS
jgi:hypothetical protein